MNELEYFARKTATHEAGHLIALKVLGGAGHVRIERRIDATPDDRPFAGRCHIDVMPPGQEARRLVGLAGVTAECLADDPDLDVIDLEDWLLNDVLGLSETDARYTTGWTVTDLEKVLALLREHWADVKREAGWHVGYLLEAA